MNVTVDVFPEPETVLAPQSNVRYPLEIVVACPGLQTLFVPSMVNRFGAAR